ncbi:MAG TPA: 2-hydroxyhepta-2,4-diene-1,7-dioate isomerase, partial [Dehalococcoidia bacterium]|nr:2-hydroxyhepta-2,4-diene-1,7-dioate isomerase [Dehalococcoidia bacterium]
TTGLDGDNLQIQCRVNGQTVVDGSSSGMIWNVAELVSWVS